MTDTDRIGRIQEILTEIELRLAVLERRFDDLESGRKLNTDMDEVGTEPESDGDIRQLADLLRVEDMGLSKMESNESWTRFAWRFELSNTSQEPLYLRGIVQFLDIDGFEIDLDVKTDIHLLPNQTSSFTGSALIDASVAERVDSIGVEIWPI